MAAGTLQFDPGNRDLLRQLCNHPGALINRRLPLILRRHIAKIQHIDDLLIPLEIIQFFDLRWQRIKPPIRLLLFAAMTADAMLFEKSLRWFGVHLGHNEQPDNEKLKQPHRPTKNVA